jgi:hypothetical protein
LCSLLHITLRIKSIPSTVSLQVLMWSHPYLFLWSYFLISSMQSSCLYLCILDTFWTFFKGLCRCFSTHLQKCSFLLYFSSCLTLTLCAY